MSFPFIKGHGTHNDFVVLPDLDGSIHGDLDPRVVAAVCDRRGGIGADGVLRVIRSGHEAPWFMDYRNADGSVSEMCGNGIRVFARYLAEAGLVDPAKPLAVDTRDGLKHATFCDDGEISVDMGVPTVGDAVTVSVRGQALDAVSADIGNPHAVVVIDSLDQAGDLRDSPFFCSVEFPHGVNLEFVERRGNGHVGMRVFERGVGETSSCGTGACAVAAVMAARDGRTSPTSYTIDVPGGVLTVRLDADQHAHLKGPAVLVAEGTWTA
ncbi:MAG: diaminopimelate epimerase [Nocardioidaceae bacterium]|nr:diaminopimelate epimerase [Nocardioidaceae bacterium]